MAYKNLAYSLIATAPSPATSGVSLVVTAATGTKFPAVPFNATIWPVSSQPTTANAEIVTVTAVSTDTLTITRAQEGTAARTVIVGDQIAATITAAMLDIPQANTVPGSDQVLMANYSSVIVGEYVMDASHELIFADPSEMAVI